MIGASGFGTGFAVAATVLTAPLRLAAAAALAERDARLRGKSSIFSP